MLHYITLQFFCYFCCICKRCIYPLKLRWALPCPLPPFVAYLQIPSHLFRVVNLAGLKLYGGCDSYQHFWRGGAVQLSKLISHFGQKQILSRPYNISVFVQGVFFRSMYRRVCVIRRSNCQRLFLSHFVVR